MKRKFKKSKPMVRVKNNRTNVESTFTDAEWENVKNNPMWKDVFTVVQAADIPKVVPKELQNLGKKEDKKAETNAAPIEAAKEEAPAKGKEAAVKASTGKK